MENQHSSAADILGSLGQFRPVCGIDLQRMHKIKAHLAEDDYTKIYHLVNSHAINLREKTASFYQWFYEQGQQQYLTFKNIILQKPMLENVEAECKQISALVAEMPKEWLAVQLTLGYSSKEHFNIDHAKVHTSSLNITVFHCGETTEPFVMTVDEIGDHLQLLLDAENEYHQILQSVKCKQLFDNRKEKSAYYSKYRANEEKFQEIINEIEKMWFGHWKCFFVGKYADNTLEEFVEVEVQKALETCLSGINIKAKSVLRCIIRGASHLKTKELENAVAYCVESKDDIHRVLEFIQELNAKLNIREQKKTRRPVLLILDELLEIVPWEALKVSQNQQISRMPSLHHLYVMFKMHEKDIKGGFKIIRDYRKGKFIINPDENLDKMSKRITTFYNYWLPDWTGIINSKPTQDEFHKFISSSDIVCYHGHGSGSHLRSFSATDKTTSPSSAVVLLFGCASNRIWRDGPHMDAHGTYYSYLITGCPTVLGMLQSVTDLNTDVFTTNLLSTWIPSEASHSWNNIDLTLWRKAESTELEPIDKKAKKALIDLSLLGAVARARSLSSDTFIKFCVVRGLPVKIQVH